jgi:ABC-type sugar transport system substrate-binding protein
VRNSKTSAGQARSTGPRPGRRSRRALAFCALGGATALALAACSSSGPSSSSNAISAAKLASLKATVAKAEQPPKWTAPGPAVSASVLRGKSLLVMPINSEIDACNSQAEDFKALGTALGAKVTYFSDAGVPTQWVTGIQDATSAHDAALVMLCGIIPGAVAPQLQAAHKAGLAVVDGNYNETSNYKLLDGVTSVNTAPGVADDVDDALVKLDGKPIHALVVASDSVIQGPAAIAAAASAVKSACPKTCTVNNVTVPIQNWASDTQSDVDSALLAHPDINAVIVTFDGMVPYTLPAVEQVHRKGLQIYTWGGSRSIVKLMLKKNSLVAADPAPDEQWDAYEAMDQVIRLLNHKPAASVSSEVDPNRFWVPSITPSFFGPGGTYGNEGYGGNAFINGFRKLWGLPAVGS